MSRRTEPDWLSPEEVRDEWWVEYLEEETDPSLKEDLALLLQNSIPDQKKYLEYRQVRTLLKKSDDVLVPEDGYLYSNMHDRIMAAVDGKRPKKQMKRRSPNPISPRRQLGFSAILSTAFLMILIACLFIVPPSPNLASAEANTMKQPRTKIVRVYRSKAYFAAKRKAAKVHSSVGPLQ